MTQPGPGGVSEQPPDGPHVHTVLSTGELLGLVRRYERHAIQRHSRAQACVSSRSLIKNHFKRYA